MAVAQTPNYARAIRATKLPPAEAEEVFDELYYQVASSPLASHDTSAAAETRTTASHGLSGPRAPPRVQVSFSESNGQLVNGVSGHSHEGGFGAPLDAPTIASVELLDGTLYNPEDDHERTPLVMR